MKLTITTSPKSITIVDSENNRMTILKGENGLEFHSSTAKKANQMLELGKAIKKSILNPSSSKDNYRVRFNKLTKQLTEINKPTFLSLRNALTAGA